MQIGSHKCTKDNLVALVKVSADRKCAWWIKACLFGTVKITHEVGTVSCGGEDGKERTDGVCNLFLSVKV